jgi:hypothetical protein
MDVEKLDPKLSDDDLVRMISARRDEESVLTSIKEISRRQSPRRLEVFRQVLADPKQEVSVKKTAVTQLGTEPLRENQEILLEQVDTKDPGLYVPLARSLGKIGDERALERLEKAEPPDDSTARRVHEFAKSLIAYRLRLNTNFIAEPSDAALLRVEKGITFEVKKADGKRMGKALAAVRKDLPAVPLAEHGAARLDCRGNELLLMFTGEFAARDLDTLGDRNALPLVILKNNLSLERYFLDYYLFTHPSRDGREVIILGTRPRGDLTFKGRIQNLNGETTFELHSVSSRYAPAIEVEGRYHQETRSWDFTKAITDTTIGAKSTVGTPRPASPRFGRLTSR